jgi:hypothetical protein
MHTKPSLGRELSNNHLELVFLHFIPKKVLAVFRDKTSARPLSDHEPCPGAASPQTALTGSETCYRVQPVSQGRRWLCCETTCVFLPSIRLPRILRFVPPEQRSRLG